MMAAIILSGGNNRRIGIDKAFLSISGRALIEREIAVLSRIFIHIIIVTNKPEKYKYLDTEFISDLIPGKGPLGGMYTGLSISRDKYNFVVSCDLPFLNAGLISYMKGLINKEDVIVPEQNQFREPLHAFYSKDCMTAIKKCIDQDDLRIQSFFPDVKVRYVDSTEIERFDPEGTAFFNVNTEENLISAKLSAEDTVRDGQRF